MIKLGFELDVQDGWPPYDVEHLWVEQTEAGYIIKSVPFFLKELALGDTITAVIGEYNYVKSWNIVEKSGNSTFWIIVSETSDVLDRLEALGCDVEGGAMTSLYSVNIPRALKFDTVDSILSSYVSAGSIDVAYPAIRHE
jgi:hypothetical protein